MVDEMKTIFHLNFHLIDAPFNMSFIQLVYLIQSKFFSSFEYLIFQLSLYRDVAAILMLLLLSKTKMCRGCYPFFSNLCFYCCRPCSICPSNPIQFKDIYKSNTSLNLGIYLFYTFN